MARPGGVNSAWICDDDGNIGNFSNQIIIAKCNEQDFGFFVNDYVRFIARIEGLSLGFVRGMVPEHPCASSAIDFDLIHKVCTLV